MSEPAAVVVTLTDGAPVRALATAEAPMPLAPLNATTVSDWLYGVFACVDVTAAFESAAGAVAVHISVVPPCVLTRLTSDHANPPPDSVSVCAALPGPSDVAKATSTSPGRRVLNAAVVWVP